jgi:hypothetical protein
MALKDTIVSRSGIFGELLYFLWHRKLWWLIPIVAMLVVLGSLMILGGASGLAPFIYSLF